MTYHGIAGEAYDLVHGDRAESYGHPRFDFSVISTVWTGLLRDLMKDGAEIDPYRVAILMSALKLCRLVKSPDHHDSRVDTIGYMLTMERLDEPEEGYDTDSEFKVGPDGQYVYSGDEEVKVIPRADPILLDVDASDASSNDDFRIYTFAYADEASGVSKHKKIPARSYAEAVNVMRSGWPQPPDAEEDDQFKVLVEGELANVVSGLKLAGEIEWQEGDRLEALISERSWVYGKVTDTWFRSDNFSFSDSAISFRELRSNCWPLKVTSGVYKGLLIFKDGVGYAAE